MRPEDDFGGGGDPLGDPLKPPTDEFGRTDPEALEREARRKEREQRRETGEHATSSGRRKKTRKSKAVPRPARRSAPAPDPAPPPGDPATPPPASRASAPRAAAGDAPSPTSRGGRTGNLGARAGAGRDALRERMDARRARRTAATSSASEDSGDSGDDGPRSPKPPKSTHFRRRIFAATAILIGLLGAWFLIALFQPFSGDGEGDGTVSVTIPEGADAGQIADILDENAIVSNSRLFQIRLKLSGKSSEIQAGDYTLAGGMSYATAIDRLTGEAGAQQTMIVIPEGFSRPQIAEKLATTGIEGNYEEASTASPGFDSAAYGAKSAPSLEGFLFPATYELPDGATATDLVAQQVGAFKQNVEGVDMSYAKKKNLTVYDVLIIASMVERETSAAKERPLIAAVIYNRLSRGQPLGIDATTRFETGNYEQPLTNAELQSDTPFNTRTNQGLPPTPIGNPGLDSIKAAARPAKAGFLYYVAKPGTCEHTFANTEAEFNAAVAEYNAAREQAGGNSPTSC